MKHPVLRALALALPALLSLPANAVVESGHWSVFESYTSSPQDPMEHNVVVDQTVDGDYTGTILRYDPAANTLTYISHNTDEGSQLFLVRAGDVLTHATLAAVPYSDWKGSFSLGHVSWGQNTVVGEDFYLGVRTGSASDPGYRDDSPEGYTSFGWAHFREGADGRLFIVDSAMAFRESGIVVGTMQAVPEPAAWASMLAGLVGLSVVARRRQARRN